MSNLCGYSDVYIHVKITIRLSNREATVTSVNNTNKKSNN